MGIKATKKCPYCGKELSRQGWQGHWRYVHKASGKPYPFFGDEKPPSDAPKAPADGVASEKKKESDVKSGGTTTKPRRNGKVTGSGTRTRAAGKAKKEAQASKGQEGQREEEKRTEQKRKKGDGGTDWLPFRDLF